MLTAEHITCRIGDKTLVQDISLQFEPGKLHLILGPNGAGKSSLMKILSGQLVFQEGSVQYDGTDLHKISVADLSKIRSVLSQHTELSFPMKVSEVVMMGRYPHFGSGPDKKDIVACREAMEFFGVSHMAERDYTTLSGGEKQRVNFARVIAQIWYRHENQLRYLLLDEPLTFLDVYYQHHFMNKIDELMQSGDLVVVGVVHDLNLAAKFADHIALIADAKLVANGTKGEVLTVQNINRVYGLQPQMLEKDGARFIVF